MFDELRPHLVELRKRLAISAASLIVMFFAMFYFHEPLLNWMVAPLNDALVEVGKVSVNAANGMVTTSQVGGAFFVALKVSFFAAIVAALPIILSQIWLFIAPGLYAHEKKMLIPFIIGGTTMFIVGVLFAYYIVTPFGFDFLITFGSFKFTPLINIEDYVGFFTKIMFGFGLAFELPIFAYFLALLGLVDDRQMTAFFKYAIVIIFIVAALLTPPDVLTQLLMAGPLIILYGISIIIVKLVNPAKPEEDDEDEDIDDEQESEEITATIAEESQEPKQD
ncbi:twin-arginine translocase subunit TatC [Sulfurimonas paralvinellae]|uniref:Sec-independent protein translocase protein TatC n=1 Tax=Sulfurimonas paralvinellae TaxID=317658 RepID=A0A7M1B974_9BACT|nr:twin-arginine translocase subunit TatC [Sulfurimonas paralvinellae]QOP46260.1 twin-arginine translocase subunit TatC [Sulfurimonas paralvinellae]